MGKTSQTITYTIEDEEDFDEFVSDYIAYLEREGSVSITNFDLSGSIEVTLE